MKEVLQSINTKLTADTTLKGLVNHTDTHKSIRRFSSLQTHTYNEYLLFGKLQFQTTDLDRDRYKIKTGQLELQALDKTNDINCLDIIERAIEVLDGEKLSVASQVRSLQLQWSNSLPVLYDNDIEYYRKVAYFDLIIVMLS